MENEVNPTSGEIEVSVNNGTKGGAEPQAGSQAQATPASEVTVICKDCGLETPRTGPATKYCDICKKNRKTKQDKTAGKTRQDKKKVASYVYDSTTEPTKAEAKEILTARGLKNQHVLDFCYDISLIAAELNHVTPNRFYFANGLRKTQASYEAEAPQALEAIPAKDVTGELLNRAELYAHYDYGFWRHLEVSFDQWLVNRLNFKTSAFELSKILGKEDFGEKHKEWTEFAPRWNPIGLPPNYTQRQALQWLDAQRSDTEGDKKRYLLVASRNSMKSTWARIHALCLTLCCGDAAILAISETNKLTSDGMTEWKGYVEMAPYNPSLFQQYFGEVTVPPDSGKALVYKNPMAHLSLPQPSFRQTSMQAANTGSRFWMLYADDPVSNENYTANEEQRATGLRKYSAACALGEPAAFILNTQTPWIEEDLGDVLIKKNNEDPEHPIAVRIDPVMEIKREARHKDLLALKEEDVILNFLPKLNWKFVRDKMRDPQGPNWFKTQYMCQWIKEDEGLKVQFDHDEIWRRVKPMSYFQPVLGAETFLAVDRSGGSVARTADFNAAVVGRLHRADDQQALVLLDAKLERARDSELIVNVLIPLIVKHKPSLIIFEEDKHWADFEMNLRRELVRRNITVPRLRHISVDTTPNAKAKRIKRLELPLALGRLFFYQGIADLETCLLQLEKFDGRPSHSHKKEDFCDSLAILADAMLPRTHEEPVNPEDVERRQRAAEAEYENERRRAYHDRIVNGGQPVDNSMRHSEWQRQQRGEPQFPPAAPAQQPATRFPNGAGRFASLPSTFRTTRTR
jgi:hypothetical protein